PPRRRPADAGTVRGLALAVVALPRPARVSAAQAHGRLREGCRWGDVPVPLALVVGARLAPLVVVGKQGHPPDVPARQAGLEAERRQRDAEVGRDRLERDQVTEPVLAEAA